MNDDVLELSAKFQLLTRKEQQLLMAFCKMLMSDPAFSEAYKALVDKSGVPLADDLLEFMDAWKRAPQ